MLNYSQQRQSQKLLMERSRKEEVPQLVTAPQPSKSKDARNKLLMQARAQTQIHHTTSFTGTDRKNTSINSENTRIKQKIQQQRNQNDQLRAINIELKSQLQKMKHINHTLILRLKEMQTSYRTLRSDLEKNNEQEQRKLKINIYSDLEEYIKIKVEELTLNLKQEKMTLALENKLQNFLTELLEINSVTVQQFKKIKKQPPIVKDETCSFLDINSFAQSSRTNDMLRYTTINTQREQLPSQQNYSSIMQRLTGQKKMSQSYAVVSRATKSTVSQDSKLRTLFAATPQKRKRIFQ